MKKTFQVVVIMLTFALFISACQPVAVSAQQNSPQVQNTQSLVDTQSQINTAVAQTIAAQNQIGTAVALTTEAQHTATPTATMLTIPTLTPFAISTPTTKPSSGGGSAPRKADYSCDIIRLRPTAYAVFHRGQEFDIRMTVVNTGLKAWYQGYDLRYTGGAVMTTLTRIELPAMAPGDKYEVVLDATAPAERGDQTMTWMVQGQICYGYVTITVE